MKRRPAGATGWTRRDWVRFIGAGTATLALGCGDNLTPTKDAGVAVLEPWAEGFLLAIWAAQGAHARVIVRLGDLIVAQLDVPLGDGGLGSIDIAGLEPGQRYEVTTLTSAGPVGPNVVRTAPADDDRRPVRVAVSADFDPSPEFDSDLVENLLGAEPELFVSIGDFPYTDNGPVANTVAEYRSRHLMLRTAPAGRRLLEGVGLRAIYDDHEFHNDWNPAFVEAEPARYAAAMQVWDEMFPIRDPVGEIRYRSWQWGANLELFLLDCRRFRSRNDAPDDAQKQMLGATQRAWLAEGLARSSATFKLIFTSVPLDFGTGNDSWVAFTTERALLLDSLVGIPGVLFATADQHYFAAHRHAHGVREFMTGPIARGLGDFGPVGPGVLFRYRGYNVGLFEAHEDRLEVSGVGADGQTFYSETLTASDLTPR